MQNSIETRGNLCTKVGLPVHLSWTERIKSFVTRAFHKISIKMPINNTQNMPQVTLSNNSAISIDTETSDL